MHRGRPGRRPPPIPMQLVVQVAVERSSTGRWRPRPARTTWARGRRRPFGGQVQRISARAAISPRNASPWMRPLLTRACRPAARRCASGQAPSGSASVRGGRSRDVCGVAGAARRLPLPRSGRRGQPGEGRAQRVPIASAAARSGPATGRPPARRRGRAAAATPRAERGGQPLGRGRRRRSRGTSPSAAHRQPASRAGASACSSAAPRRARRRARAPRAAGGAGAPATARRRPRSTPASAARRRASAVATCR